jgi:hypothetical protein
MTCTNGTRPACRHARHHASLGLDTGSYEETSQNSGKLSQMLTPCRPKGRGDPGQRSRSRASRSSWNRNGPCTGTRSAFSVLHRTGKAAGRSPSRLTAPRFRTCNQYQRDLHPAVRNREHPCRVHTITARSGSLAPAARQLVILPVASATTLTARTGSGSARCFLRRGAYSQTSRSACPG